MRQHNAIPSARYNQDTVPHSRQFLGEGARADDRPRPFQLIQARIGGDCALDMLGGATGPNDLGEITRREQQGGDADPLIVRGDEARNARS